MKKYFQTRLLKVGLYPKEKKYKLSQNYTMKKYNLCLNMYANKSKSTVACVIQFLKRI